AQSARDGVPISGRNPAPASDSVSISHVNLTTAGLKMDLDATRPGTAHVFLWSGDKGQIPVYLTSCGTADPPPDHGPTPRPLTDAGIPAWSPDMSGRSVRDLKVSVAAGRNTVSIPLDAAAFAKLTGGDGSALVSFETPNDEVQAFDVPLREETTGDGSVGGTV